MSTLIEQIHNRRAQLKLSWHELAEAVHKDVSTVKKQLSSTSNPSLCVLEEYASILRCHIALISSVDEEFCPSIHYHDHEAEIKHLHDMLEDREKEINDYRINIQRLREQYDRLSKLVILKDAKVEQLNERIYTLLQMLMEEQI